MNSELHRRPKITPAGPQLEVISACVIPGAEEALMPNRTVFLRPLLE